MSKNLTRKGLALGALVGLASTAIAGTPAFAADEVTFALSSGTVYAAPVDDTLTLNAALISSVPAANIQQLKYKVVTDGSFIAKSVIKDGTTTVATKYTNANNVTGVSVAGVSVGTYGTTTGGSGSAPVYTGAVATSQVYAGASTNTTLTNAKTIVVSVDSVPGASTAANGEAPSATTATKSVTVTAFIDSNSNDTVDAGEYATSQTLSFKKYSEITATYTLTAPSEGATSVSAKATFTNINQAQLNKTVTGKFSINASTSRVAVGTTVASGVYSATDSASISLASGDVVGFQALLAATAIGTTELTATATARTIDALSAGAVVAGDNATSAGSVRNAGKFAVRSKATKSSAAVAGISGTATFDTNTSSSVATNVTLDSTHYVTINGTDYKTDADLIAASVAVTSGADGYLSVEVTTTGFTAGQQVVVTFAAQNITATAATATIADAQYYAVDVNDPTNTGVRRLLASATATVSYVVMDQWAVAPADGTFRLVLTTGSSSLYQAVVGGKASFTVTGGSANAVYTLNLQKWNTSTAVFDAYTSTGTAGVAEDGFTASYAATASVATAGSLTVSTAIVSNGQFFAYNVASSTAATTKLALSDKAFSSVDTRLDKKTTAPTLAAGYKTGSTATSPVAGDNAGGAGVTLTIQPKGSDVAATSIAAPVTVSGKGMLFVLNQGAAGAVYATDSITFLANGTPVVVYSHTAGDNVVTVTSGTATKTVTLTYATIAAEASTVVYGTLPAQAQAGRAVDLSAIVKDQWGNTVPGALVAFTNTGVGYVQSTAQVTSDAAGKVTGRLIVLQNDFGTSYLSATLDLATDVVIAKSIEFGLTDVDVVAGGHRVFVNAEFALGRTVTVTIDGKRVYSKVQTTDNAVELAFTQKKKGAHTVTVRISGGIVATEKVTTN